jgi:probable HAF family extracellular repeat protein
MIRSDNILRDTRPARVGIVAATLVVATNALFAQTLTWLGTLGGDRSWAFSVSADGAVVVGWARNASGHHRAYRWTRATGLQDLGTLDGVDSEAYVASADGAVVVGYARNADGQTRAFRWTQTTGMRDLGTLGGNFSLAYGLSADGTVVVG